MLDSRTVKIEIGAPSPRRDDGTVDSCRREAQRTKRKKSKSVKLGRGQELEHTWICAEFFLYPSELFYL